MMDYTIKELTEEKFLPLFDQHKKSVFEDVHAYSLNDLLTELEQQYIKDWDQNGILPYKLYLAAFDKNDNFIGWSWGKQENGSTFYMVNSAVLPPHRGKGLYRALVTKCTEIVAEKGFQLVYSRHCATNNAVIIPKLRCGFIISKMEIDDRYGVLIHLHFYTNKTRRQIMDYRSGQSVPNDEIKKLFKL